jgi:hypothetical protein
MGHRITYHDEDIWRQYARCRCGFITKEHRTRDNVEDEVAKHQADVERIRLHLHTGVPTLKSQARYYRDMAENPQVEESDRLLWARLADELEARLGPTSAKDETLFDMAKKQKMRSNDT